MNLVQINSTKKILKHLILFIFKEINPALPLLTDLQKGNKLK